MNAGGIRDIGAIRPLQDIGSKKPAEKPGQAEGPSFGQALENALQNVDSGLQASDAQAASYIAGDNVDLHNVILGLERADLGLRTMVQVRNKLLDAYREVMRMPV